MAVAKQNLKTVTPLERELIEALAVRYAEGKQAAELTMEFGAICSSVPTSDKIDPRDLAYAAKMRQVAQKNPTNPDVLTLYAESELLTIPGHFWIAQTDKPIGRAGEIADRLEAMLAAHPSHIGLNHYMTHVVDVNAVAQRAVPAAERLASLAPASPHLQHMSTHIFMRVGRYSDAIQANVAALAAEDKLDVQLRHQGFEPVKNWRPHNSQFLMISALMAGRGDIALDIARTISRRAEGAQSSMGEFSRSQPLLVLLRLERYKDLLRETRPAGQRGVASILYLYSRGVALAKTHDLAGATAALAEMRPQVIDALTSHASENFPDRMVRAIVQVAQDALSAEVAAQSGEKNKAIEFAKNAAKIGEPLNDLDPPMLAADPRLA
ncbi:hypothetical protein, partial [Massilia pseudoviolaceinigra]|uniref:hypothetical protein n=1 Tax=Massilia pseudoviolaceinigra TaxID=3057165 RepID=UPI002796770F